ncbi:MAG: glutamate--cysteine ligase [Desulfopila sp.]|jgi:glutamate--cysteine ligase|nr:glutamate--cysteine ligase [Desulfopila sp.]
MTHLPIENRNQLVEYLESGIKPLQDHRIGTEHEKFGFHIDDFTPLKYEGNAGIRALLKALSTDFGWEPIEEDGNIIALQNSEQSITLEPGGQFELSGAPLENLHQTCAEIQFHLRQVRSVAEPLGIGFLGMGFAPSWRRDEMPWMPKERYRIMRRYMPSVGTLGLDMMVRTATVQVNLDFCSEADMVKKFRVALALQPLATALFANSPFSEGKPNGWLSYRSAVWRDTDPDRSGMLPFVFEPGMGFERYAEYALDVPMYFVHRDNRYIDAAGHSFRDFLAGKLSALPGERPTVADWEDHLTTLFPEVRLKRYLEMRGADAGTGDTLCAMPAFWVGLLYDQDCLDAAWRLVGNWSAAEREQLRCDVARQGLQAFTPRGPLQKMAEEVLHIAKSGLQRRACRNDRGDDEAVFLDILLETAMSGKTPAELKLERFHTEWQGSILPIFEEFSFWRHNDVLPKAF